MTRKRLDLLASLLAGVLFGVGLVVSGMTRPEKVLGFLDIFGAWDPSLALVMAGAIAVHFFAYRFVRGRPAPLCTDKFALPTRRDIDVRLLLGAMLFGLGWGLGGYCPGPGLVSLATGTPGAVVFVASMLVAMFLTAKVEATVPSRWPKSGPAARATSRTL